MVTVPKTDVILPSFKSTFGSLNWHIPLIVEVVGKERIRKTSDVNKELPKVFLRFLEGRKIDADIISWKTLEYNGKTFEGKPASKRYIIVQLYSLAIPSCINLGLVSQQNPYEMLTFTGRKLLKASIKNKGALISENDELVSLMKKIVLTQDKKWGILRAIESAGGSASSESILSNLNVAGADVKVNITTLTKKVREELTNELTKKGMIRNWFDRERISSAIESSVKKRVNKKIIVGKIAILNNLLSIYSSLNLVKKDGKTYSPNRKEISAMQEKIFWNEAADVDNRTFFFSLNYVHEELRKRGKTLVPIPMVRDLVCEQLDMPWEAFDKKLSEIGYSTDGFRISLSRAIYAKKWGVNIGKINYYYISIIK